MASRTATRPPARAGRCVAAALVMCAPFVWAITAQASADAGPKALPNALLAKPVAAASDDDHDHDHDAEAASASGGGTSASGAGSVSDGTVGDRNDSFTRGATGAASDRMTGRETASVNTDRPGLNTGVSTVGETDPGDRTA